MAPRKVASCRCCCCRRRRHLRRRRRRHRLRCRRQVTLLSLFVDAIVQKPGLNEICSILKVYLQISKGNR